MLVKIQRQRGPQIFHSDTVDSPMQTEARERRNRRKVSEHSWQPRTHSSGGKREERRKQNFLNEGIFRAHVPRADKRLSLLTQTYLRSV